MRYYHVIIVKHYDHENHNMQAIYYNKYNYTLISCGCATFSVDENFRPILVSKIALALDHTIIVTLLACTSIRHFCHGVN